MSRKARIGGACLNQVPMDWSHNLSNIRKAIVQARTEGIEVLCLPELVITGYGCEDMFLSEWIPTKAAEKLVELLPDTKGIAVAIGLPYRKNGVLYNVTCFIHDQSVKGFYAKQKLANDGVHYEPRWFTPWPVGVIESVDFLGQEVPFGHIVINHLNLKIAFEICEDAWRTDRPASHLASPVDLILNPSASHFAFGKAQFREALVIESSRKFNCAYLYANLLGNESGRMIYDGDIILAQNGELKGKNSRLSFRDFKTLNCVVDFDHPEQTEKNIRADKKGNVEEFGTAASLALFDYLRKSRSKGFVLSLSGGADSSSLAVLVSEMVRKGLEELGFETFQQKIGLTFSRNNQHEVVGQILHTAYQGTVNSSESTLSSAKTLAESLGANFYHWNIDEEVNQYIKTIEKVLQRQLSWEQDDIALQNIQARARSPVIWMLANIHNCLLLATSNRSEGDVGYTTMDGDTSGSISPIAAVDKHFILQWLQYAEKELGYVGLHEVNQLAPTAELRPPSNEQTDEGDLMPYEVLRDIEALAIRDKQSPAQVYQQLRSKWEDARLLKTWIIKFFSLWSKNQWKRERLAPSFHLDDFNVDPRSWCRFPILSGGFNEELKELSQLDKE